jgi:hypothetical protein
MHDASNGEQEVIDAYRQRAPRYDDTVRLFDFFVCKAPTHPAGAGRRFPSWP